MHRFVAVDISSLAIATALWAAPLQPTQSQPGDKFDREPVERFLDQVEVET